MFEGTINEVRQVNEEFGGQIRDSFGSAIAADVFEPLGKEEQKLHYEYEMAEAKMTEIRAITAQLSLII